MARPCGIPFRRQETFAYLQIPCSEIYGTLMVQLLYNLYSTRIELVIELVGSNGPNDRTCKIQKGEGICGFSFFTSCTSCMVFATSSIASCIQVLSKLYRHADSSPHSNCFGVLGKSPRMGTGMEHIVDLRNESV